MTDQTNWSLPSVRTNSSKMSFSFKTSSNSHARKSQFHSISDSASRLNQTSLKSLTKNYFNLDKTNNLVNCWFNLLFPDHKSSQKIGELPSFTTYLNLSAERAQLNHLGPLILKIPRNISETFMLDGVSPNSCKCKHLYIALINLLHSAYLQEYHLCHHLPSNAWFLISMGVIFKPPNAFGKNTRSQFSRCILRVTMPSSHSPQLGSIEYIPITTFSFLKANEIYLKLQYCILNHSFGNTVTTSSYIPWY